MIIADMQIPHDCFNCRLEMYVDSCPCRLGISSASEYKRERHKECPLKIIPDNATNGDVMKAMYPLEVWLHMKAREFNKTWWNAPYKGVGE